MIEWVPFLSDEREDHCSDEDALKRLAAELALQLKTDVRYHSMDEEGIATMLLSDARVIFDKELQAAVSDRDDLTSDLKKDKKDLLRIRARVAHLRSLLR